jgi:hypothetical protein
METASAGMYQLSRRTGHGAGPDAGPGGHGPPRSSWIASGAWHLAAGLGAGTDEGYRGAR